MTNSILTIRYPNGATRSLLPGTSPGFRAQDANGKTYRIGAKKAAEMVEDFDHECNEGNATLVAIDDKEVAAIRRHHS